MEQKIKEQPIVDNEMVSETLEILGDRFSVLFDGYVQDCQDALMEIDLARSGQVYEKILEIVHSLKSSSFQMGAMRAMASAQEIEMMLRKQENSLNDFQQQQELDKLIVLLRTSFQEYVLEMEPKINRP